MNPSFMVALIVALFGITEVSAAETRVPSDIAAAYDHPRIAEEWEARPIVVSHNERYAVYVVKASSNPPESQRGYFLENGSPLTSDGNSLWLFDFATRRSHILCRGGGNSWNPAFSPEGGSIAFYSDRTGSARLWIYDLASDRCLQISNAAIKSTYFPFDQPRWAPDGKTVYVSTWPVSGPGVASVATVPLYAGKAPQGNASGVTVFRHNPTSATETTKQDSTESFEKRCSLGAYMATSLSVVDVPTGASRVLVADEKASQAAQGDLRHHPTPYYKISHSGRWLSYYSTGCSDPAQRFKAFVDLYIVPVAGGTPIRVVGGLRMPAGGTEFDDGYRWHPNDDVIVYLKDGELWRSKIAHDGTSTTERLGQKLGPLVPSILRLTPDGRAAIVAVGASDQAKARPVELTSVPLNADRPTHMVIGNDKLTIKALIVTENGVLWQPKSGIVTATAIDEESGDTVLLDFDCVSGKTSTVWRGSANLSGSVPTAKGLLTVYEDFATPPNLVRISPDWRRRELLSEVSSGLLAMRPGRIERFKSIIALGDGTLREVYSSIILPHGAKRGDKLPAVVWFYPTSNFNRATSRFGAPAIDDLSHIFTDRGYAVLLVDMPLGRGDQKGSVVDEIMDDLMPQVHKAVDLGYIDPGRLALRGQSFGGFATVAVIARTKLFRAAIASSGVYDLGGNYGQAFFLRGDLVDNSAWAETGQPRLGGPIWDDPLRYIENSPYYQADRIHTPLLILQGTNDPIGFSEGPKMFVALRRLDRPVELALYDGGGHSPANYRAEQAQDQALRMIEFLDRHIGPHDPLRH